MLGSNSFACSRVAQPTIKHSLRLQLPFLLDKSRIRHRDPQLVLPPPSSRVPVHPLAHDRFLRRNETPSRRIDLETFTSTLLFLSLYLGVCRIEASRTWWVRVRSTRGGTSAARYSWCDGKLSWPGELWRDSRIRF